WIQYLKNNQIINLKSDYASGKLSYKRNPTSSDLLKFLDVHTDIDQKIVKKAIQTVLSQGKPGANVPSTWMHDEMTPGEPGEDEPRAQQQTRLPSPDRPKKYSNDDAEDVEFRDAGAPKDADEPKNGPPALSGPKRKPRFKYRNKPVTEAFYDRPGDELSEDQIRAIFKILASAANAPPEKEEKPAEPEQSPEEKEAKAAENMNKIRRLIRDKLSPAQRAGLWKALSEVEGITEAFVDRPDVIDIFQNISSLGRNSVDVSDLQKAWRDARFPDDTQDIYAILKRHGYGNKEIERVFDQVLGSNHSADSSKSKETSEITPATRKLVDFIKANGMVDDIKAFMKSEFGEELGITKKPGMIDKLKGFFGKKAVAEDVRAIFTAIVKEERTDRLELLRSHNYTHLGRNKK
ncbi:MAG TPA: hypothetical protein VIY47_05800, partial [Ignavibacteriaceae bacterium]